MTESERCIVCGRPATITARLMHKKTGSIMTVHFCERHEKGRMAGKRRTKKVINKRIRGMFK